MNWSLSLHTLCAQRKKTLSRGDFESWALLVFSLHHACPIFSFLLLFSQRCVIQNFKFLNKAGHFFQILFLTVYRSCSTLQSTKRITNRISSLKKIEGRKNQREKENHVAVLVSRWAFIQTYCKCQNLFDKRLGFYEKQQYILLIDDKITCK